MGFFKAYTQETPSLCVQTNDNEKQQIADTRSTTAIASRKHTSFTTMPYLKGHARRKRHHYLSQRNLAWPIKENAMGNADRGTHLAT